MSTKQSYKKKHISEKYDKIKMGDLNVKCIK